MGEIGEFSKQMKALKKQRQQEKLQREQEKTQRGQESPRPNPAPRRRCYDWMLVSGTCHYAKNRSSFSTYRRIGREVPCDIFGGSTYVAGIGTVKLQVRSIPRRGALTRTIVLENVLHVPSAICNGFNFHAYHRQHGGDTAAGPWDGPGSKWNTDYGTDPEGHPLWYSEEFCGLERLVLAGEPQGETYLKEGGSYFLSMYLSLGQKPGLRVRSESPVSEADTEKLPVPELAVWSASLV
ncbi:uncharacterized protein DSM5745_07707 [Aspergillus mulundensis]|uniref:Retrovirus-related Pol polyprotein from transposon TNT 1-94-like beta-barrel domain-containing protein n=1 Tax=Aspergillus mulundensis TaxID=1810919 RepID=A0A3D8RER1_9EURO|nr:hypothetical protein DSM5745_07707 [Aspergillus mulundensis]RDW72535.1 hypothetical protein DSM5745_07707 [Aspergillus mulundensis]